MRAVRLLITIMLLAACDDPAAPAETSTSEAVDRPEPLHLEVPPRLIARARQEAAGLLRMPLAMRRRTLERRRAERGPSYEELRREPDRYAHEGASFEGQVGFVRSAGQRLWILPLHTRRVGQRWVDPIYVLSSIPPQLPVDGGAVARVDGFVVGARTIGQNTLPLIVAYFVEELGGPASEEGDRDVPPGD